MYKEENVSLKAELTRSISQVEVRAVCIFNCELSLSLLGILLCLPWFFLLLTLLLLLPLIFFTLLYLPLWLLRLFLKAGLLFFAGQNFRKRDHQKANGRTMSDVYPGVPGLCLLFTVLSICLIISVMSAYWILLIRNKTTTYRNYGNLSANFSNLP